MAKRQTDKDIYEDAFDEFAGGSGTPPVDETFLQLIEAGEIELTDDLAFDLAKQSSGYLSTPPFHKKMEQWTRKGDFKKLTRIRTITHPEHRGRSALESSKIAASYIENIKLIGKFLKEHSGKRNSIKNELFKELYPNANIDFRLHRTARQLAVELTTQQYNISTSSLYNIIKEHSEYLRKKYPSYIRTRNKNRVIPTD